MSQDEVVAVLKARQVDYDTSSRYDWEQTRLKCFYSALAFGGAKNIKEPKDLFKLPWDNELKGEIKTVSKDEALKRLQDNRKNRFKTL